MVVSKVLRITEFLNVDFTAKVVMTILLTRLTALGESQHLTIQFAFRSDKGCNYGEYTRKQLHGTAYLLNSNLYFFNVDINI